MKRKSLFTLLVAVALLVTSCIASEPSTTNPTTSSPSTNEEVKEYDITINVVAPINTPSDAEIALVGSMVDWDLEKAYAEWKLTRVDATHFSITKKVENATKPYNFEYKVVVGPSWEYVEKNADGSEMSNRTFSATNYGVVNVELEVARWASVPLKVPTLLTTTAQRFVTTSPELLSVVFEFDLKGRNFVDIKSTDSVLNPTNYTFSENKVAFEKSYLKTLANGTYTYDFYTTDGKVEFSFEVNDDPCYFEGVMTCVPFVITDTSLLANVVKNTVVPGPRLMITEVLMDSGATADTYDAYEYIEIYNNSAEPYDLAGHRLILGDPTNAENVKALASHGMIITRAFEHYFYDFVMQPFETVVVWNHHTLIENGSDSYKGLLAKPEIAAKTIQDFKRYHGIPENVRVYRAMMQFSGNNSANVDQPIPVRLLFTGMSGKLLRTIQIQKIKDNSPDRVTCTVLNKWEQYYHRDTGVLDLAPKLGSDRIAYDVPVCYKNPEDGPRQGADIYNQAATNTFMLNNFEPVVTANIFGRLSAAQVTAGDGTINYTSGQDAWGNRVSMHFAAPASGIVMEAVLYANDVDYNAKAIEAQKPLVRISPNRFMPITVQVPEDVTVPTPINALIEAAKFSSPGTQKAFNFQ